mmetsp:Transcript_67360/g.161510  ORF Transcript_67360/g.161510 Transcript_67360/m.161510 type:complete len:139 (-) Transcript_67360:87-503(-)
MLRAVHRSRCGASRLLDSRLPRLLRPSPSNGQALQPSCSQRGCSSLASDEDAGAMMLRCSELLGLREEAKSAAEVRAAYRQMARKLHPDRGGSRESFQDLHRCYQAMLAASPDGGRLKAADPPWLAQMKKDFANFSCC